MELLKDLGIGFVPPPGRGSISGKIQSPGQLDPDDWRLSIPRCMDGAFGKNLSCSRRWKPWLRKPMPLRSRWHWVALVWAGK